MVNPRLIAKIESEEPAARLAVLIDADNAQAAVIEGLLAEIAKFGEATIKRIYGDFTSPTSASWKKVLQKHAIKPVQQFAYTSGKNATDSTLIIEAMDLLYTRKFDGFCLVTSDSDFTGLAIRLKEEGLTVLGFGEQKTPDAFRNACHKFILTEVLRTSFQTTLTTPESKLEASQKLIPPSTPNEQIKTENDLRELKKFLLDALENTPDESGWVNLGTFGSYLNKIKSDFDPRRYGYKKLSDLTRGMKDILIVKENPIAGSDKKALYIKAKDKLE